MMVEQKENDELTANSIIKLEDQLSTQNILQASDASDLNDRLTLDKREHLKNRSRRSERPDSVKVNALKQRIERLSKQAKQSVVTSLLER